MRPLSDSAARVTAKVCSRKFVALGRVLRHWEDIVGADLAAKAQPVRLTYRRARAGRGGKRAAPDATLHIATTPAQATALHYQTGVILERINQVFGERWITALRFTTAPEAARGEAVRARPEPTRADVLEAAQEVEAIDDPEIRAALARLGASVLAQSAPKRS